MSWNYQQNEGGSTSKPEVSKPKLAKIDILAQATEFEFLSSQVFSKIPKKPAIPAIYFEEGFTTLSNSKLFKADFVKPRKAANLIEAIHLDFDDVDAPLAVIENAESTQMEPPESLVVRKSKVVRTYKQRKLLDKNVREPKSKKPRLSGDVQNHDNDSASDNELDESFTVDGISIVNKSMEVEITDNSKILQNLSQLSQFYVEEAQERKEEAKTPDELVMDKDRSGLDIKVEVESDLEGNEKSNEMNSSQSLDVWENDEGIDFTLLEALSKHDSNYEKSNISEGNTRNLFDVMSKFNVFFSNYTFRCNSEWKKFCRTSNRSRKTRSV